MPASVLARYLALATCAILASGQTSPHGAASPVIVNLTALDSTGRPVADLTSADDFQVFDDGRLQQHVRLEPGSGKPATVILLDLLNSIPGRGEYLSGQIAHVLEPRENSGSIYLYLLTNHGDLYPVRGLIRGPEDDANLQGGHWSRYAGLLLKQAIKKVFGLRGIDDKDQDTRAVKTFQALGELTNQLKLIPGDGSKTIVWMTTGAANWLHPYQCQDIVLDDGSGPYVAGKCRADCMKWDDHKCLDLSPLVHRLSSAMSRTGAVVYSVDETPRDSLPAAGSGSPQDTLQQFVDLTGGHLYVGGDVQKAISRSLTDTAGRYRLVFEGTTDADGKYHKLRVVCVRKGVRIEATRGYYADRATGQ